MASVAEAFALALQHHRAGNLGGAQQIYELILQADSRFADAHHLLGVCFSQLGRHEQALASIQQAIALNPSVAAYYSNLGLAQQAHGQLKNAVASYRRALQLQPDFAEARCNLSGALAGQGKLEEAVEHGRQALLLQPHSASAHNNLGYAFLRQEKLDEAADHFQEALRIQPNFADAHNNLGVALTQQDRMDEAVAACDQALRLQPNFVAAHNNLGHALRKMGKIHEAVACFRRALEINPDFGDALHNLGTAWQAQGQLSQARACFEELLRLQPDFGLAYLNLGTVCLDEGQLAEAQACFERARQLMPGSTDVLTGEAGVSLAAGRLDEAKEVLQSLDRGSARRVYLQYLDSLLFTHRLNDFDAVLEQARCLLPDDAYLDAVYLFRLHFDETVEPAKLPGMYRQWSAKYFPASSAAASAERLTAVPRTALDRIRVAYVATYLHHTCMDSVLRYHDRQRFDILVFTDDFRVDLAKTYPGIKVFPIKGNDIVQACRQQGVAIAVDMLGPVPIRGGMAQVDAFQQRLAPIQCLWIATIDTTGSAAMDYVIADWQMIGPEQESRYTERLARLPDVWHCWTPPEDAMAPGPLPARGHGAVTFGSANRGFKLNAAQLRLWARVIARCPGSRFHLKGSACEDKEFVDRLHRKFAEQGLSAKRLICSPSLPYSQHLNWYQYIDISLDTYPYNGGLTTLESLWMGVPVVSRSGPTFTSRLSRSFLYHLGYSSWVTASEEEYVQRACDLAADLDGLEQIRLTLREKLVHSAICNGPAFTRKIEQLYAKMLKAGGRTNVEV